MCSVEVFSWSVISLILLYSFPFCTTGLVMITCQLQSIFRCSHAPIDKFSVLLIVRGLLSSWSTQSADNGRGPLSLFLLVLTLYLFRLPWPSLFDNSAICLWRLIYSPVDRANERVSVRPFHRLVFVLVFTFYCFTKPCQFVLRANLVSWPLVGTGNSPTFIIATLTRLFSAAATPFSSPLLFKAIQQKWL